jgi:hypothetical protein
MRGDTDSDHERVAAVGTALGFESVREWSPPLGQADYRPRIDVLWAQRLSPAQSAALETVGANVWRDGALPIAAWEIEGSDVSTKGMAADLANLRISQAPYGFLAVRGGTKDNLYERALCVARTQRHYFGCQAAVPLDTRWLSELSTRPLSNERAADAGKPARGGGGEGAWTDKVRDVLRERGASAGFGVTDSFRSLLPREDGFTQHQIDLVWTLPMPKGLRTFVEGIGEQDHRLESSHLIVGPRYQRVAVAAFEIENSPGKHGFGGLLTLASHGMRGVFVAGDRASATNAAAALSTYRRFMGLAHVVVFNGLVRQGT